MKDYHSYHVINDIQRRLGFSIRAYVNKGLYLNNLSIQYYLCQRYICIFLKYFIYRTSEK